MLTIEQFKEKYPNAFCYDSFSIGIYSDCRLITEGFLKFTDDSACSWAGPFEGGHAQFVLTDWTKARFTAGKDKDKLLLECWAQGDIERKARAKRRGEHYSVYNERPTLELPFQLKMYGNDDTSYAKFYKNEQEALEELQLFISAEPLEFNEVIDGFKFYFTN